MGACPFWVSVGAEGRSFFGKKRFRVVTKAAGLRYKGWKQASKHMNMRHQKLHLAAFLLLVGSAAVSLGCSARVSAAGPETAPSTADGKGKVYQVASFDRINIKGVAAVHFTQGAKTSVRAVPRTGNGDWLIVTSHDGWLTIDTDQRRVEQLKKEQGQRDFNIDVYVSSPSLRDIDISGVCNFSADAIETPSLELDMSGVAKVEVAKIKSPDTRISCSGTGKLTAGAEGDALDVDNSGTARMDLSFKGKRLDMRNRGTSRVDVDARCSTFNLDDSGTASCDIRFTGGEMTVRARGTSRLEASVDCTTLRADNSGTGSMTFSGTADNVKLSGRGVSSINTSGLNRY